MSPSITPQTPVALLVNPSAGGGRSMKMLRQVERALDAARIEFRVERTRGPDHGADLALEAAEAGEVPVVMSGDGLIGVVGGAMAGSEVPMGIVPAGRGNDLARVLGIPTDPEGAVTNLLTGEPRAIDVGEANGQRFLGIASVGFDSEANRIANRARWLKGPPVYAYAALRALAAWKPVRFTVDVDGTRSRFTGYTVAVANSQCYGGGMFVAPDAELDDGRLDVVTIGEAGKLRFLANLPKVFKGTHVAEVEEVESRRGAVVSIDASKPLTVFADGDPLTELPVRVRVIPRALKVIVGGQPA